MTKNLCTMYMIHAQTRVYIYIIYIDISKLNKYVYIVYDEMVLRWGW